MTDYTVEVWRGDAIHAEHDFTSDDVAILRAVLHTIPGTAGAIAARLASLFDYVAEETVEEMLPNRIRQALERAHDRSELKLGDDDLDIYEEEIARLLRETEEGRDKPGMVGNVIFDDTSDTLRLILADAGYGRVEGGMVWFDVPYLPVYDKDDPDDLPLYVMHAGVDGGGATVYAPSCLTVEDLEQRCIRAFGEGEWTLDDHGVAVTPEGAS